MSQPASPATPRGWLDPFLDTIEWAGNRLPDPAVLFLIVMFLTWGISALLAPVEFTEINPRTNEPIRVLNQLEGTALVRFLTSMVTTFTGFAPLGVVLVALLGVGVAEHTGFIAALLKGLLQITPNMLLTPMVLFVAIISHSAGDTGYVLVIPLGGVIFATAGRHPLAGIVAAFAGVSGGFSANFLPSGLDPLLQGFTQTGAQLIDPTRNVNPLCNLYFTGISCVLIIGVGWFITDRLIEPRLKRVAPLDAGPPGATTLPASSSEQSSGTTITQQPTQSSGITASDGESSDAGKLDAMTDRERFGMIAGLTALAFCAGLLALACWPAGSPFRSKEGHLASHGAPLMDAIVPLIFLFFLVPGIVHGYVAGTVTSHRDIVKGMSKSMSTMGYYLVMAFFAALFTYSFRESNLGALLAIKGATFLQWLNLPAFVTILGVILITTLINLLIGSASAKWALLAPIFVPMLMKLDISPELTQAAYRVGDSSTNIITPLMPYFPLIVVYCQRYTKGTGIGNLVSYMLPYSLAFLVTWTLLLLLYWQIGLPLGLDASYKP